MRRPLYLDVVRVKAVALDWPALRVSLYEQAAAFFPLRQVSRVVVTGKVEWAVEALWACLDYGVPVAFRERDGRLVGHCLSDRSNATPLEALLQEAADTGEGDALYQQWRVAEERRWVLRMKKLSGLPLTGWTAQRVLPQLEPWLKARLCCELGVLRAQLQAPIASHVAEVLAAYGFSDNAHLPLTRRVHVSRDVAHIVLLEAYWLVGRLDCALPLSPRGLRYTVVAFYEAHQAVFEQRARVTLNRLWRLLKHREADT